MTLSLGSMLPNPLVRCFKPLSVSMVKRTCLHYARLA